MHTHEWVMSHKCTSMLHVSISNVPHTSTEVCLVHLHTYSVLQCVAVCCSVLQCVAVCCSVLQLIKSFLNKPTCAAVCCGVLRCVAVCCSVLPCAAVCCSESILNEPTFVAECYSVLQQTNLEYAMSHTYAACIYDIQISHGHNLWIRDVSKVPQQWAS